MPLLDHFHTPQLRPHWHSFHHAWATHLAVALNGLLPARYYAEPNVQFGIENHKVEVSVYDQDAADRVVAAIELVSPANKDRPAAREAFATKCETYLRSGMGVMIVDVVTEYRADLHDALLRRLEAEARTGGDAGALWAASYHPVEQGDSTALHIWAETLSIGQALPTLALGLGPGLYMPVDLEATYTQTRDGLRIDQRLRLV
jgi:hypothetical protein